MFKIILKCFNFIILKCLLQGGLRLLDGIINILRETINSRTDELRGFGGMSVIEGSLFQEYHANLQLVGAMYQWTLHGLLQPSVYGMCGQLSIKPG